MVSFVHSGLLVSLPTALPGVGVSGSLCLLPLGSEGSRAHVGTSQGPFLGTFHTGAS